MILKSKFLSVNCLLFFVLFTNLLRSETPNNSNLTENLEGSKTIVSYPNKSFKKHNFGVTIGPLSGFGPSYRIWTESGTGHQFTLLPVVVKNTSNIYTITSAGYLGLYNIKDWPVFMPLNRSYRGANVFAYYGGHFYNFFQNSNEESPVSQWQFITLGGGVGLELHFWSLNWSFMTGFMGYGASKESERFFDEPGYEFSPSAESSWFYNF